ncbi:DUF2937 family protein [Salinibius halmophilus]|uniref:DUF2937 family protein n=1 Tax=Salinibius halmophilus TaxID=1853216 RepID=UPI000E670C95|nr:DUF2937 family protein [Salinibius halmophilus]
MYRFFCQVTERLVFLASALLGMQIPAFLASYRQRLDGQLFEATQALASYREIAVRNHEGDMQRLIDSFLVSSDASSREVGFIILETRDKVEQLQAKLMALSDGSLFSQLWHFFSYWDGQAVQGTWQLYQPTILLTFEALICALLIGFIGSAVSLLVLRGPSWLGRQLVDFMAVKRGRDMAAAAQRRLQQ